MPNAYISGTGFYVPPKVVTNQMLVDDYGIETSHDWIVKRTGIEARRYAEEGIGSSDLAKKACEMAIEAAGLTKKDIGLIIFATLSPDHAFPGSGVYLQEKLGFAEVEHFVPCLDIRNQCSGFVYGMSVATSMVQSGGVNHVLLVGAETHSAALDFSTRGRSVASLFGDGAGAVVVSATDEDRGVRGWSLGADGRHADELAQKVWNIAERPFIPLNEEGVGQVSPEAMWCNMRGKVVFKHAVRRMIEALMQTCMKLNLTRDDIDLFCFHQANLRINEMVAKMLEIPDDKVVHNIQRYGNTTAATIPMLLAEAERSGKLKKGMTVAMVAFGSGFTWGSVVVDW